MKSYREYSRQQFDNALVHYFQEAFSLKQTPFGTNNDYDNQQFESDRNIQSTYFLLGETLFKVDFVFDGNCYHVKFSYEEDGKFTYKMKYDVQNSLKIFNIVMYIVSEFINEYNVECIAFSAHESNPKLKSLYGKMLRNKSFKDMMSNKGFEYYKEEDEIYFFTKKENEDEEL